MNPTTVEIPPEAVPNLDNVVIDDGAPVDGILPERNMRLLTERSMPSGRPGDGRPFTVLANVGLFHAIKEPPIVAKAANRRAQAALQEAERLRARLRELGIDQKSDLPDANQERRRENPGTANCLMT